MTTQDATHSENGKTPVNVSVAQTHTSLTDVLAGLLLLLAGFLCGICAFLLYIFMLPS